MPIIYRIANFSQNIFTNDPTLRLDLFIVWTQTQLYYSLISATLPILRPYLNQFSTLKGGLGMDGTTYGSNQDSQLRSGSDYKLSAMRSKFIVSQTRSQVREEDEENIIRAQSLPESGHRAHKSNTGEIRDTVSVHSSESQHMMIRKDISFTVTHVQ